jgi:hypothetical protein
MATNVATPTNGGNKSANKQKSHASNGMPSLNPERPPQLLGKYTKLLGTEIGSINVVYTSTGTSVTVYKIGSTEPMSLSDFKSEKKKGNAPSVAEKARAFRNKFELRLNREFPAATLNAMLASDDESALDSSIAMFIETLPFRERRALLMTQKQFASAHPNGYS